MQPFRIQQNSLTGFAEQTGGSGIATRLGLQVVTDFYTFLALVGRGYQVRAGTLTTPLVGDVVLTDTAAEVSIDALTATTIIPVELGISVRLATGTLHEYALKSVGTISSAGTAATPLPLRTDTIAASAAVARVSAAGGVTVTAETAANTLRLWEYANPVAAGAGNDPGVVALASINWMPKLPAVLVGPRCLYLQIAATGTGPSYYAHCNYLEVPTATLL